VQRGVAIATEAGFKADGLPVADDVPVAQTLLRVADEQDAPVLVVGAHRRGGSASCSSAARPKDLLKRSLARFWWCARRTRPEAWAEAAAYGRATSPGGPAAPAGSHHVGPKPDTV
jgi:hypothetical protein